MIPAARELNSLNSKFNLVDRPKKTRTADHLTFCIVTMRICAGANPEFWTQRPDERFERKGLLSDRCGRLTSLRGSIQSSGGLRTLT
jgi:hypothetical protein